MLGTSLEQPVGGGGIQQHIQEPFQNAKKGFGSRGLRIHDLIKTTKEAIASLATGTQINPHFNRVCSESQMGGHRVTARNPSGFAKSLSIPYREAQYSGRNHETFGQDG